VRLLLRLAASIAGPVRPHRCAARIDEPEVGHDLHVRGAGTAGVGVVGPSERREQRTQITDVPLEPERGEEAAVLFDGVADGLPAERRLDGFEAGGHRPRARRLRLLGKPVAARHQGAVDPGRHDLGDRPGFGAVPPPPAHPVRRASAASAPSQELLMPAG
jgi:hypothetical protein